LIVARTVTISSLRTEGVTWQPLRMIVCEPLAEYPAE